jgi:hypothetical protein
MDLLSKASLDSLTGLALDASSPNFSSAQGAEQAFFRSAEVERQREDQEGQEDAAAGEGEEAAEEEERADPELLKLPRRSIRRRHPVVSFLVIALSLYLMWFLRADLLFFFQGSRPQDVGEVEIALKQGRLQPNAFVKLSGTPDRKHARIIEQRFGGYYSFFRLLGTSSQVFVQKQRQSRFTDEEVYTTHVGQLVAFNSLPYATSLKKYFGQNLTVAHDLDFKTLKGALGQPTVTVRDVKGEAVTLDPDSLVWINVAYPNEWIVQFSKHVFSHVEGAEDALRQKLEGLDIPFAKDEEPSRLFWRFVVLCAPEHFPQLQARLKSQIIAGRPQLGLVRRQISYSAPWNKLGLRNQNLVVNAADPTFPSRFERSSEGGAQSGGLKPIKEKRIEIPAAALMYISTSSAFSVPDDALVLLVGKTPKDNWYYLLLYFVLLAFVGVNVGVLFLRFRQGVVQGAR